MKKDYELSNVSFTNKDFFDVYPELLQLAKRLSAKWDPTVSNESDPGVVLIKELALITDKINYIADKYALENNPRSVTQIENARQLYNLLGYYPEWYQSAKVNVSIYWDGEKESDKYVTIPKFTAIQDADNEFVYTTLTDITLPLDGTYASGEIEAIEGTYNRLVVNNSDVITLSMLSDDQRIYIGDYNVATNGIFVTDSTGTIPWTQVTNINIVESSTRSYSFNVDIVTGQCYLQFPRDIAYLIGDGLIIHYITSKGAEGNIPINHLSKLAVTSISTKDLDGNDVTIDCENIRITNTGNTFRGKNPVGIDEMYENWKHIAGTFDTLVTLRDYNNAVRRYPDYASNGFVTDRTNDVQLSYKVMQGTPELPTTKTKIEKYDLSRYDDSIDYNGDGVANSDDQTWYTGSYQNSMYSNKITPYDLKLYLLRSFPYDSISTYNEYNSTFELYSDMELDITDSNVKRMVDALSTFKCISHDFYLPEPGKICFLKNKYNLDLQILANQDLTSLQALEVKQNICRAVYNQFNSNKVEFGEEISYDDLLECIKNADSRIKTAILDRLTYDTYAVFYLDNGQINWFEVPVSDDAYNEFLENEDTLFRNAYEDGYSDYKDMWKPAWKRNQAKIYCDKFRNEIVAKNILAGITPYIIDVGGGYPYTFNNRSEVDTSASHLKSNVYIKMKFNEEQTSQSVTLTENEVIQFSRPNLLDVRSYGAYIYYEYIGKTIQADKDYTLGSNESIVFFYKEADKDNKYRFDIYGPGTILHPSFQLVQNEKDITAMVFGSLRPSNPSECVTGYKALPSVRQYSGLSVSDSITIKKINQVRLPRTNNSEAYIYFVTKDKENDNYLLTFKDKKRILDEGEFFIYTNTSKTSLDILGAGTEIRWIGEAEPYTLKCEYMAVSDIALYGSSALKGKWLTIKDPTVLYVVEKSFTNALEGDTVTFTLGGEYEETEFALDSSGIVPDNDAMTYELSMYRPSADHTEEEPVAAILNVVSTATKSKTENLKDFLNLIYKETFDESVSDTARLDCVQLREYSEEDDQDITWRNLYAWKCTGKDNKVRWIYDRESFYALFGDPDSASFADNLEEYKKLLGLDDNISGTAYTGTLTTISDMIAGNDDSGSSGSDDSGSGGEDTIEYNPTDLEKEAFTSWYKIFSNGYTQYTFLQNYIDYGNLQEDQVNEAILYIDYTYTLKDEEAPLNRFSKIEINGDEVDISSSDNIATDVHVYLNVDLGPDKPQKLRADDTSVYPYVIDQLSFYNNDAEVASLNTSPEYKEYLVYADVNVYGQGSEDLIDVRYFDEHLQQKNPVFYAHESIESNTAADEDGGVVYFTIQGKNNFIAFDKRSSAEVSIFKDKVSLPSGRYICKVEHSNSCLSTLKLKWGDTYLKAFGTDEENIAEPKSYYMTFDSDGSEVTFMVEYALKNPEAVEPSVIEALEDYKYGDVWKLASEVPAHGDEQPTAIPAGYYIICTRDKIGDFSWGDWAMTPFPLYDLALTPLVKFVEASGYNKDYYNLEDGSSTLYDLIKSLDYDNEFNYLYEIPGNKLIKNPLKATSFLNVNHVYNKFTICESKLPSILV